MASTSSQVLVYCPCSEALSVTRPPPCDPPLSTFKHHELSTLLFCEECDAVRCDTCVSCEIACFFCPNCLFEVPSASVRGEKNRCARNCFQCPQCTHTLSTVASDLDPSVPLSSTAASAGEPPYFLQCSFCHWDSKEVGITFEKATGLALQLQKSEEAAPDIAEFDHVKDHLEPYIRRGQAQASQSSSSTATASTSLLKDNPGLSQRYGSLFGLSTRAKTAETQGVRDELDRYKALFPAAGSKGKERAVDVEAQRVKTMKEMKEMEDVASLDKRWTTSWKQPLLAADLRPLRTLLLAKRSKRCPECKHILIKPEQKSSSTRFKIKLVASNYLPAIELYRRPPPTIGSRLSAIGAAASARRSTRSATGRSADADDEPLRPGRTYTFELSFVNPLYEPIQVRLAVARPTAKGAVEGQPPPYAVNLPTAFFPISAYAEEWEYEDDDDGRDDEEGEGDEEGASPTKKRRSKHGQGVVERKMNRTTVAMDVAVGKDTVGPIRANMLVTYVYQSDDSNAAPPSPTKSPVKGGSKKEDQKSFSFWTLFTLGTVTPRAEPRRSMAVSSSSG